MEAKVVRERVLSAVEAELMWGGELTPPAPGRSTGIKSSQGMISYPLVEVLIPASEYCHACTTCGAFENANDEPERFKRCARCKQAYYVRSSLFFWTL